MDDVETATQGIDVPAADDIDAEDTKQVFNRYVAPDFKHKTTLPIAAQKEIVSNKDLQFLS